MVTAALEALLAAGQWRAADRESRRRLLEHADRGGFSGLDPAEVTAIDCAVLTAIDRAWGAASDGRFGLRPQSEALTAVRAEGLSRKVTWRRFGTELGWVQDGRWLDEESLLYDIDAPPGHLPWVIGTLPTVATGRTYEVLFLFYKHFSKRSKDIQMSFHSLLELIACYIFELKQNLPYGVGFDVAVSLAVQCTGYNRSSSQS